MITNEILLDQKNSRRFEDLKPSDLTGPLAGKAWKLEQARERIKWAQYLLIALAGINILTLMLKVISGPISPTALIFTLLYISVLIAGAIKAKSSPVQAIGAAFSFYIILQLLSSMGGVPLAQGIVWKLVIIAFLSIGLFNAIQAVKIKKEIMQSLHLKQ